MNDAELDEMLASSLKTLPDRASHQARVMSQDAMPVAWRLKKTGRGRWFLPLLIAGGMVVTAGAGTSAIFMSHWAGVSLPLENVRSTVPIPLKWTSETGHTEACRAYIELRNPESGDRETLNSAIERYDWSGLGQMLYDSAPESAVDPDGQSRVGDAMQPVFREFASSVFPDILWMSEGVSTDARAVDAIGFTCVPEAK